MKPTKGRIHRPCRTPDLHAGRDASKKAQEGVRLEAVSLEENNRAPFATTME